MRNHVSLFIVSAILLLTLTGYGWQHFRLRQLQFGWEWPDGLPIGGPWIYRTSEGFLVLDITTLPICLRYDGDGALIGEVDCRSVIIPQLPQRRAF